MIRIQLQNSDRVMETIPRFKHSLSSNNLVMVGKVIDLSSDTVALCVNARIFGDVKWVTDLAFDLFEKDVMAIEQDAEHN